jgi:hypothetical protein
MVDREFLDGDIARQVDLVDTTIRTQQVTQARPATFIGVHMDFTDAVTIVIASIFILAVTDRAAHAFQVVVTVIFIGIERGSRLGKSLYKRAEGAALRIFYHTHTYLACLSTNHGTYRWTVIGIGASPALFVGSLARRVFRVTVPFTFFPQRSGTFRQFRLPDRSKVLCFVPARHWPAACGVLPMPSSD